MKLVSSKATVICRPFKINHVEPKKTGLAFVSQKTELAVLEVVVENPDLPGVKSVFVRADRYTHPWAKERMTAPDIDGEFILVPINEVFIIGVDKGIDGGTG